MNKLIIILCFFPMFVSAGTIDLLRGHSHNDYEQRQPLFDALNAGFNSVEADIWYREGKILVSHYGKTFKGSLEDLYLKPLQEIVNQKGFIQKSGVSFYLWVDIKDKNPKLGTTLVSILERYPMLKKGQVAIILTGNENAGRKLTQETSLVTRAAGNFSISDSLEDKSWAWYGLNWSKYLGLVVTNSDLKKLKSIVDAIHAKGRKVRFWGVPDKESNWQKQYWAGADHIGTDDIAGLSNFLKNQ